MPDYSRHEVLDDFPKLRSVVAIVKFRKELRVIQTCGVRCANERRYSAEVVKVVVIACIQAEVTISKTCKNYFSWMSQMKA